MPEVLSECVPGLRLLRLSGGESSFEVESRTGSATTVRSYAEPDLFEAIEDYMKALCATLEPCAAQAFSIGVDVSIATGDRNFAALAGLLADDSPT